jgi:predicted transcriptional regulator
VKVTVRARLSDELAYTTVLTILRTLEAKGYVGHKEEGRVHRYFAAVQQQAARKSALRHLTGKLFKGSSELLFAHLVLDAGHHCFPFTADDYRVGIYSASQCRQFGGATENDRSA